MKFIKYSRILGVVFLLSFCQSCSHVKEESDDGRMRFFENPSERTLMKAGFYHFENSNLWSKKFADTCYVHYNSTEKSEHINVRTLIIIKSGITENYVRDITGRLGLKLKADENGNELNLHHRVYKDQSNREFEISTIKNSYIHISYHY